MALNLARLPYTRLVDTHYLMIRAIDLRAGVCYNGTNKLQIPPILRNGPYGAIGEKSRAVARMSTRTRRSALLREEIQLELNRLTITGALGVYSVRQTYQLQEIGYQ